MSVRWCLAYYVTDFLYPDSLFRLKIHSHALSFFKVRWWCIFVKIWYRTFGQLTMSKAKFYHTEALRSNLGHIKAETSFIGLSESIFGSNSYSKNGCPRNFIKALSSVIWVPWGVLVDSETKPLPFSVSYGHMKQLLEEKDAPKWSFG